MTKIGVNSVPHAEEGHLLGKEVHEILQGSYRRFLPALQLAVSLNLTYAVDGRLPLSLQHHSIHYVFGKTVVVWGLNLP